MSPSKHPKAAKSSICSLASFLMIASHSASAQQPEPKLVFAHNHAYAAYGRTVEGYKQDMRDAQKAGIDGFAINYGRWDGEGGYYKRKVAMMFQAAQELGTGFKLFLSPDGTSSGNPNVEESLSPREVREAMELYSNHPNYWKYQGRPVLSAWHGGGQGLESLNAWKSVIDPLRQKGINVYFVPFFYVASYNETPSSYEEIKANFNGQITNSRDFPAHPGWWSQVVDGFYSSAVAGLPLYAPPGERSDLEYGESLSKVLHENGKTYMASVAPYYWGELQGNKENPNRRYFEYEGGKGLEAQWTSLIEKQKPEWVELFTWNDYTESTYFSPVQNLTLGEPSLNAGYKGPDFFPTHAGFLELNRYFTQWYKTGKKPAITEDKLFYFYRRFPRDIDAPDDPKGPVAVRHGNIQDSLYVTTLLTAPAELRVVSGGQKNTFPLAQGMVHTSIPFQPGDQSFELWRNGKRVLATTGTPIHPTTALFNFHVASGFASAKARPDLVVTKVSASTMGDGSARYTLKATVQNIGEAAVPASAKIKVEFVAQHEEASTTIASAAWTKILEKGGTAQLESVPGAWQGSPGNFRLWARVYNEKPLEEANDWNNTGTDGSSINVNIIP